MRFRTLSPTALLLALAAPAAAQVIEGRVLDVRSGQPVAEAAVTVTTAAGRRADRARSGADGTFKVDLQRAGAYRLRVERLGYQPSESDTFSVALRETVELTMSLSTEALAIAPLNVTGRRAPVRVAGLEQVGFYKREAAGVGHFIRRADFEGRFNQGLSGVLAREGSVRREVDGTGKARITFRGANPGLSDGTTGRGLGERIPINPANPNITRTSGTAASSRSGGHRNTQQVCLPKVYMDGAVMAISENTSIDDLIQPEGVEAIELFRGPSETPAEYRDSESACGVIVIWTRARMGTF